MAEEVKEKKEEAGPEAEVLQRAWALDRWCEEHPDVERWWKVPGLPIVQDVEYHLEKILDRLPVTMHPRSVMSALDELVARRAISNAEAAKAYAIWRAARYAKLKTG
jgi:hypothetical protein